jgi:hypothetical protein
VNQAFRVLENFSLNIFLGLRCSVISDPTLNNFVCRKYAHHENLPIPTVAIFSAGPRYGPVVGRRLKSELFTRYWIVCFRRRSDRQWFMCGSGFLGRHRQLKSAEFKFEKVMANYYELLGNSTRNKSVLAKPFDPKVT